MLVIIDNYDSFVYNLVSYFEMLGMEVLVYSNDKIDFLYISQLYANKQLEGIILSPGPMTPKESGGSLNILNLYESKVPILGVCLGHQIIGYYFGGHIIKGHVPVHGKVDIIRHNKSDLFYNLPNSYAVTRYHSLVIDSNNFPTVLNIDATASDHTIMAVSHKKLPVYGVQFHPEALLTEYGLELCKNFARICTQHLKENIYVNTN